MAQPKFKINKVYLGAVNIVIFLFTKLFPIKANISKKVVDLNEPFLLISNHIGTYDPFLVSYFMKISAHYVASDAIFRDPIIGFLFKKLGVIPKKKNAKDTKAIRDMITAVRDGGAVGLFPEGMRTWTGTSLPFDPVVVKLVKLLKIPVITAKMKGMQLGNPRWGLKIRLTPIEIDYELIYSKEEIANASSEEILEKIKAGITHDEVDYQRKNMHILRSKYRAEYIEYVLFLCSNCHTLGKIRSKGNNFECSHCNQKTHVNKYGFFEDADGKPLLYDNIRDGYNWQRKELETLVEKHFKEKTKTAIFHDDVLFYKEIDQKMILQGKAKIEFYIDRIAINFEDEEQMIFEHQNISMMNPQFHEKIEVRHLGQDYRFIGEKAKISGLKWELACSTIWTLTGQGEQISAYLKWQTNANATPKRNP